MNKQNSSQLYIQINSYLFDKSYGEELLDDNFQFKTQQSDISINNSNVKEE